MLVNVQEEQWRSKFKEVEEQMHLAVEECEMQNVASNAEQSRKIEELQSVVEQLTTVMNSLSFYLYLFKWNSLFSLCNIFRRSCNYL